MRDDVLRRLSPRFDAIYAATGRPSIPSEHTAGCAEALVDSRTACRPRSRRRLIRQPLGQRDGRLRFDPARRDANHPDALGLTSFESALL